MTPAIYHYEISWEQNMGGGRGTLMCLKAEDHETGRLAWRTLCADKLENEVRDVKVTCNGVPFDPVQPWPRPSVFWQESGFQGVEAASASRTVYAARAVEAACVLAKSCTDIVEENAIISRATRMLTEVWQAEVRLFKPQTEASINVEVEHTGGMEFTKETMRQYEKAFWDTVILNLHNQIVYRFTACFDETVNPTPEQHNVMLYVQPARSAVRYEFYLKCP